MTGSAPSLPRHPALASIETGGVVPLISSSDPTILWRAAWGVVEAGLTVLEIALREPGAIAALGDLIGRVEQSSLPLTVGAGTVLDGDSAMAVIDCGARFVFSPVLTPEVGERCRASDVAWFPGAASPTEIDRALQLECDAVKLFPADLIGGPSFLRAARSVFADLRAIPSGGITPDTDELSDWFDAGAVAVGAGSSLFPAEAVASGAWDEIERRLSRAAEAVSTVREEHET